MWAKTIPDRMNGSTKEMTVMKKIISLTFLLVLVLSCTREQDTPEVVSPDETSTVVFSASLSETKVYLGEKDGDSYPTLWQAGDVIIVNGFQSVALQENDGYVGTNHAEFSVTGSLQAPYYSAYPASAVSNYSSGSATVTIPTQQAYVAGQHDPAAYLMLGKGNSASLTFNPMVALFKLTPTAPAEGNLMINSIRLEAIGGEKMSGAFTTNFSALSGGENNYVEIAAPEGGLPFGTTFTFVIPAKTYASGLRFVINASDDTSMSFSRTSSFNAAASTLYPLTAPAYVPSAVTINGHWRINSSAITLRWNCSNPAARTKKPWKIHVYSDEQCLTEVRSYDLPASDKYDDNNHNRFVIGGLSQGTTYWFTVEDVVAGVSSDPVSESTSAFTVVPMNTNITSPGVVFAEDFSEFAWGGEQLHNGCGFIPADQSSFSNLSVEGATVTREESETVVGMRASGLNTALTGSRLNNWMSEQKAYYHPGYIKLGTDDNPGFALTPAFPIESGKTALADVTVSITKYKAEENDTYMLCVISNSSLNPQNPRESDFDWPSTTDTGLYREISTTKTMSDSQAWDQITVSGLRIQTGDRIAFGRIKDKSVNNKTRVLLNEITVDVKALSTSSLFAYAAPGITSSTIPFTWNGDPSHAFTATLYSNAACTSQVASFDISANNACWNGEQPKYVFGGLAPGTTYYLKVTDTTDNNVESNVASATTEAFSIVQMPASISSTGIALAEDFGEIRWHADVLAGAAGFEPVNTDYFTNSVVSKYVAGNNFDDEIELGVTTTPLDNSTRLAGWAYDTKVFYHCGYLKMGESKKKGWILTPEFTVPDGQKATVKVTVTAAKLNSSQENNWAIAVLNQAEAKVSGHSANFDWPLGSPSNKYREVNLGTSWTTVTVENLVVLPGDRIAFGARNGASNTKSRVFISDIKVEVTAIEAVPIRVSTLGKTSSTLAFEWNEGGNANTDNQIAYTATLYSDASCTSPVVSYSFPSGSSGQAIWRSGKYPKFIFSGLTQNTTYFLKVVDGAGQESEVIAAKTLGFSVVTMPSSITETGVVLAEDFSELCWDFETLDGCVGINSTGTGFQKYQSSSAGNYGVFSDFAFSNSRLNNWARDVGTDAKVRVHPGYITLGLPSGNNKGWLLTPEFTVPTGKTATAKVEITVANVATSEETSYCLGLLNSSQSGVGTGGRDNNTSDVSWPDDRPNTMYRTFTVSSDEEWTTLTFTGFIINPGDRLCICGRPDYTYGKTGSSATPPCCLNISDVSVTVTAINDNGTPEDINVGIGGTGTE